MVKLVCRCYKMIGIKIGGIELLGNPRFSRPLSCSNPTTSLHSKNAKWRFSCGGGGIRTHGALRHSRFQDERTRPLCDTSVFI